MPKKITKFEYLVNSVPINLMIYQKEFSTEEGEIVQAELLGFKYTDMYNLDQISPGLREMFREQVFMVIGQIILN